MIIYKGDWRIEKNPKPIPDRTHDWEFWRDGYADLDGPWQGTASSVDDAIRQIDEMMSEELKCSFYASGERAVDQKMALELFKAKALIGGLRKELAELREELEETRNAIHQWMQTSDQRGSKDMLIANFVGMYTYKEISDE